MFGTEEQKEQYLKPSLAGEFFTTFAMTEPQGGSDPTNLRCIARRDGDAELAVADQGAVIDAAERERLFSPFYRAPGTSGGQGLGLSLVRQIARRHRGDVAYTPEKGSCFTVTLPAA